MNEVVYNVTAFVASLLLLFALITPVHAQPGGPMMNNQTLPGDPQATPEAMPEATPQVMEPEAAPQSIEPLSALPEITIWYENTLQFGADGNPQKQVNILGNVRDTDGTIKALSYRLNGGSSLALSMGPNTKRLENRGDFNIAIDLARLRDGENEVIVTATDSSNDVATKSVRFNYTPGVTWRTPYSTNWSAGTIHSQAQVVDGLWRQTGGGVRPTQVGYDRLIAIGDMNWSNYEILVPITTYGFYPDPNNTTDAGGVGVIARWTGHTGTGSLPQDWNQIGAYAYWSNRLNRLALRLNDTQVLTQTFDFRLNRTYMFKLRVEVSPADPTTDSLYSFKIWEAGTPEPSWNSSSFSSIVNIVDQNDARMHGSILLVAHRADALFGNVTVCPPGVTYPLRVNIVGGGTVNRSPSKTNYNCGEGVTLTADPDPGWTFAGWSGDLTSTNPSLSFNMTGSRTITATFRESAPIVLDNHYYAPFINRK